MSTPTREQVWWASYIKGATDVEEFTKPREVRCMLCNDECARHGCAGCHRYSMLYAPREVAEAFSLYLNSGVAMLLFSKLLLYRASGDNARVVVKYAGKNYRVSIHRTNGEIEHFNRDGKE